MKKILFTLSFLISTSLFSAACDKCIEAENYVNNHIYRLSNEIYDMEVSDFTFEAYKLCLIRLQVYADMRKEIYGY